MWTLIEGLYLHNQIAESVLRSQTTPYFMQWDGVSVFFYIFVPKKRAVDTIY